jgi:hypothetical protein
VSDPSPLDPSPPLLQELAQRDRRLIELLNANARLERELLEGTAPQLSPAPSEGLDEWRARAERAEAALHELQVRLEHREARIDALLNSLSWRLSAPLRAALRAVRKVGGSDAE